MRILLLGSIAYDNIMVFDGRFREHILPDQIHMLNVAFLVPALRREFGGQYRLQPASARRGAGGNGYRRRRRGRVL